MVSKHILQTVLFIGFDTVFTSDKEPTTKFCELSHFSSSLVLVLQQWRFSVFFFPFFFFKRYLTAWGKKHVRAEPSSRGMLLVTHRNIILG